ncbi:endoplasmic reticulum-Golgi intermediate compartment protein 1-like [Penaeus japonicus]|uniref:endoplasmic reticulum-Golgi intermediate compartment protein 1-like n=1 Tax=Penaeus japonicus TaxID=27405 RepID=UPI001C714B34|nr:endoplasmic reticulum-Golgi intermediate compartment protein 1-like [Penaeus japonicus]
MGLFSFDVRRLDIYRKVPKDLTQPTITGAVISVTCMTFMLLLFTSEFLHFLSGEIVSELYVDNPGESTERIPVYIKVSLPRLKCDYIGLDIQDDLGRHEVGFVENTVKTPIGEDGCMFEANFLVNKVPGNFHVSTHSADEQPKDIDFAHVIHEVRFGSKIDNPDVPGTFNPLLGRAKIDGNALESHDYVMKVVPTIYESATGNQVIAYQYTYAYRSYISFSHGGRVVPAVWFRYDLTPITVKYHFKRPPFYSFITTVCAIVGGTFTVAGIIDSFIFTAAEIFKKIEIGKQS